LASDPGNIVMFVIYMIHKLVSFLRCQNIKTAAFRGHNTSTTEGRQNNINVVIQSNLVK